MNVLLATDSFKGSLGASQVVSALKKGIKQTDPMIAVKMHPMGDGGEGTAEILRFHKNADVVDILSKDPMMKPINSRYFANREHPTAYIDMAEASGLHHMKGRERNILAASTFGTGILIKHAIRSGLQNIVLGLGGSATCDCGIGMAASLGFRFLDKNENEVYPIPLNFSHIQYFDASAAIVPLSLTAVCDVSIPLLGKSGTIKYASQKGAGSNEIDFLNVGLTHIASILDPKSLCINKSGSGAAGGLGFCCAALLGGQLVSGIDFLIDQTNIISSIEWADLVVTGEGSFDLQTLDGKLVSGIARIAAKRKKPCVVVCGKSTSTVVLKKELNVSDVYTLLSLAENETAAIDNATHYLEKVGENLAKKYTLE